MTELFFLVSTNMTFSWFSCGLLWHWARLVLFTQTDCMITRHLYTSHIPIIFKAYLYINHMVWIPSTYGTGARQSFFMKQSIMACTWPPQCPWKPTNTPHTGHCVVMKLSRGYWSEPPGHAVRPRVCPHTHAYKHFYTECHHENAPNSYITHRQHVTA